MCQVRIITTILLAFFLAGCGDDSTLKKPASIHYYQNSPDLVDVARYETSETNGVQAAEDAVILLGDYLKTKGTVYEVTGIAALPIAADSSYAYKYGNYLIKVSETAGVRLVEVRIPALEQQLLEVDPGAVYALPFRFVVIPGMYNNISYVHVCLVDPHSYLSQFASISPALAAELVAVRSELMGHIRAAFPDAFYDPAFAPASLPIPGDVTPLVKIAEIPIGAAGLEGVAKLIQGGNLLMKTSEPPNSSTINSVTHTYTVNDPLYTTDYLYLLPEYTIFKGFFSFPRFSAIKDGKVGTTSYSAWKIVDQSAQMECLVPNSIIHAFGKTNLEDPGQRIKYETSAGDVYQLQVFDGYISPFLMNTSGISHFAALPISVYVRETSSGSGNAGVYLQNPLFTAKRSFHEVTDAQLAASKPEWDANPKNKTKWPVMTRDEMAQFSLATITKVVVEALK